MKVNFWPLALLIFSCADDPEQPQPTLDLRVMDSSAAPDLTADMRIDRFKPDYRSWEPGTCWPPCGHSQYCHLVEGCAQQSSGVCLDRPRSCSKVPSLVCGCDNETYDNDCVAHTAGTNILHFGECEGQPDAGPP